MSAVILAVFEDYEAAERVRVTLVPEETLARALFEGCDLIGALERLRVDHCDADEDYAAKVVGEHAHQRQERVATQTAADLDDDCGNTKACKRMADVGFGGMAGPDEDLHTAWRNRLAREGKLNAEGGSVADLVLGRAESH